MINSKLIEYCKQEKADLAFKIMGLGASDDFNFAKEYYILSSQWQLLDALEEMVKRGDFNED